MTKKRNAPLHWPVTVNVLPSSGFELHLEASPEECVLLAEKAAVEAVHAFSADLVFKRWRKNGVSVRGDFKAEITQACSITLEPIENSVSGEVDRLFLPEGSNLLRPSLDQDGEMVLNAEGADLPEPFDGHAIDAWPVLIEQFILEIDPFPRKPDAELPTEFAENTAGDSEDSPFAGLKQMLERKK